MTTHERPFGRCLEDFTVGDVYKHWPGKTITEYDDHLFCMITMNHHPLHTNVHYAETEVLEIVPSKSKNDRGIVKVRTIAYNQDGQIVCEFVRKVMIPTRESR